MQISFLAASCGNLAALSSSNFAALSCSNLAAHCLRLFVCGYLAACSFFVCKLVFWLLVVATLRLLVAACLRLYVCRECVGPVVEPQTPEQQVGVRSSLKALCCVLEQDTFIGYEISCVMKKTTFFICEKPGSFYREG